MSSEKDENKQIDSAEQERDVETTAKKIPYPKSVFFILANEFCERFSFYGMKAILTLYLKNVLKFNEDTATVIYHAFVFFTYFTPLFGAMIADSFLGKFRTIFYLSVVYALGNITLSLSATPPLNIPGVPFSMLGLALIAIGTGGIKPCVSSFGGDQFILPQQERQLSSFFSIFYFSINAGSTISTFITPILRRDVQCFDEDTCYALAFVVPAALMITSLLIFLAGKSMYLMREPTGNVFLSLIKAIKHALSQKRKSSEKKEHWMDYAEGKYTRREIEDIKIVLRILFLFIPVPLYWALYDQQGSRWTFQASRMDGALGSFILKPDQLQVINPILVMILIPVFDRVIYPVLAKFNMLKTPLQKMVVGMTFVALAFVISGVVEIELEKTYPIELEAGEAHVNFMNMAGKNLNATLYSQPNGQAVENFGLDDNGNFLIDLLNSGNYSITLSDGVSMYNTSLTIESARAKTYLITTNGDQFKLTTPSSGGFDVEVGDMLEKQGEGQPYVRLMQVGLWEDPYAVDDELYKNTTLASNKNRTVILDEKKKSKKTYEFAYEPNRGIYPDFQSTKELEVEINTYVIYVQTGSEKVDIGEVTLELGASYIVAVVEDESAEKGYRFSISYVTSPNSLHMLWLVPQYFIISCGEIMFSITIMDFCYSQAPKSMKSVMQSAWLLTVAIGNLIDVIIAALKLFDSQWKEFFLFAGLMFADIIIFAYMAYKYIPADIESDDDILKPLEDSKGGNNNTGNENDGYESDKDR